MNTWSVLDEHIKHDNTFDFKKYYNRGLLDEDDKLRPKPISNEYINRTGQAQLEQPFIEKYTPKFQLEKELHSTWATLSSIPCIQVPTGAFFPETFPFPDTKVENNNVLKIELEQILDNLNYEIEENNIVVRRELARWFEKNGKRGINTAWNLPGEILSSEDKMPELLIALGIANDYTTINERLELLDYYSTKESSKIRYGVILGLANLASYKILPMIKSMKKKEKTPILKQIMASVLSKYGNVE